MMSTPVEGVVVLVHMWQNLFWNAALLAVERTQRCIPLFQIWHFVCQESKMSSKPSQDLASISRSIARAGLVIVIGRIMARILGLVRVSIIASIFGRSLDMDAYTAAWAIPNIIYDLLLNGVLVAVLVTVLREYADGEP